MVATGATAPQRFAILPTSWDIGRLETISSFIEAGLVQPVIDRSYQLAAAADGLEYLGQGHARGKVVVII
jgi:NADPH:quinone reductase-like Zn-dependent oxidoreductase